MGLPEEFNDQQTHLEAKEQKYTPYEYQTENNGSWAGALPVKQYEASRSSQETIGHWMLTVFQGIVRSAV